MSVDFVKVQRAIDSCVRANLGIAYMGEVRDGTRPALQVLAEASGVDLGTVFTLADDELIKIYAIARKEMHLLPTITDEINRKHSQPKAPPPFDPFADMDTKPEPAPTGLDAAAVAAMIADALGPAMERLEGVLTGQTRLALEQHTSGIIEEAKRAAIQALHDARPTNLVVKLPDRAPVPVGVVHYQTPRIIKILARGDHVYLHGPAGSGKTTCAAKVAEAFNLPLYTVAKVESEYLLLGFRDARGEAVRTPFREAYENGGVFLFDELDGSSPGAIVALNMALANGMCPFPDATIRMHKDFKCIAAGNTSLRGSDRQYTGRSQLDAASIDRFSFVDFPYDEALEEALATHKPWLAYVRAVRSEVGKRQLPLLVTPRATIAGGRAMHDGETWQECAAMYVFKGLDADTVEQIHYAIDGAVLEALEAKPAPEPVEEEISII